MAMKVQGGRMVPQASDSSANDKALASQAATAVDVAISRLRQVMGTTEERSARESIQSSIRALENQLAFIKRLAR